MAEGATIANAFVQIMPSAEGATSAITDSILPSMEGLGQEAGSNIGGGILDSLKGFAGPIAGVLAGLGIGKALLDIGTEFDSMTDTIILGTGASGEALDELTGIAKNVATTVPVSFSTAGDYIQDLNTRLGLTGDDLQNVATQLGALDSMMGGVNVETLSGAFAAWGIEAENMSGEMDYLFSVSQNTGLSFDSLTSILESTAPAMQALGFSFDETANMAGLLDKAGMDANGTMSKMNKALVELAGEGGDASQAFEDVLSQMEGFIESGDRASALDLASTLFGTRGAAQFVGAVESGALSIDDLRDAALGAGDGIIGTYEATADWAEKLDVLKNKASLALEPLAGFAFDALGAGIDIVTSAFDAVEPVLTPLVEQLGGVFADTVLPGVQTAIETLSPVIEDLGTIFTAVATFVVDAITVILETVVPAFNDILTVATDVWSGIKDAIEEPLGAAKDFISSAVQSIKSFVEDPFNTLKTTVTDIWNGIKSAIEGPINTAKSTVKSAIDSIKGFFNFEFHWPHIPLPHFSISGSVNPLDWLNGGLPSISVSWYAKGGIIDEPTLYAAGVGEKGAELVWPSYEPYFSKYAEGIAEHIDGATTVNNYYIDGNLVSADARLAAALDVVAERVGGRRRMGTVR